MNRGVEMTKVEQRTKELMLPLAFPIGLPGFEAHHGFVLVPLGPQYGPYLGLRSVIPDGPVFVVVQPSEVGLELTVDIDDFHEALLDIQGPSDVFVLLIVSLEKEGDMPTANTLAPLVINVSNWKAAQIPQSNESYSLRQKLSVPFFDPSRAGIQA
jgi:flagellar assembly factor FliW